MPENPARDDASEEELEKPRWYGWQTLATDGAALTSIVLGVTQRDGDPLLALGLGGYLLGAPTVHLVHDRVGTGLASLGLRVGAPLTGMMLGAAATDCSNASDDHDFAGCGEEEGAWGFVLGVGAAIAIDAAVLAREPARRPARERTSATRPRLAPGIALTPEKRALVLSGTF